MTGPDVNRARRQQVTLLAAELEAARAAEAAHKQQAQGGAIK